MPKQNKRRVGAHGPSVRLPTRKFAIQSTAVESVDVGSAADLSAAEIFTQLNKAEPAQTKKEKLQHKRDAFLDRLELTRAPYSKNHSRRLKQKAKEQLAGGMNELQVAITNLDPTSATNPHTMDDDDTSQINTSRQSPGMKGQPMHANEMGKPLTKAQRMRALKLERLRQPLVLSNPDFVSNPFQTIRTHVQNTLLKCATPLPPGT